MRQEIAHAMARATGHSMETFDDQRLLRRSDIDLFTTATSLIDRLTRAHAEGRLEDKLKLYTAPRLLI